MKNFSINAEDVLLNTGKHYLIIDALYLDDIKNKLGAVSLEAEDEIKQEVFPYTEFPYSKISLPGNSINLFHLKIANIKKVDYNETIHEPHNCFCTDTGLILVIEFNILESLLFNYNYDTLVEGEGGSINQPFWEQLTKGFDSHDIALILAPGTRSGHEFEGSGCYKLTSE